MFAATESLVHDLNAYFDGSQELLHAIADVLDVRAVFPRVSEIASRMLPHDALTMASQDEDLNIQLEAASTDDCRGLTLDSGGTPMTPELLIGDLAAETHPYGEWPDMRLRIRAGGYRSLLRVAIQTRDRRLGVGFWSKKAHAYNYRHVPVARRILDHLAVGMSHERLARIAAAGGHERAHRVDAAMQPAVEHVIPGSQSRVVGESVEWRGVLRKATQVASTDTTVLITGESGTGKEVVARFIHAASVRKNRPFVALNCAALPEQLLESELFGYERGAFTGAQQAKPGQVELAWGGVLFLDEVSEMSLSAQAKFLRVLQERELQRLGATRVIKANIRVIAATNRDLRKAVERGEFREDLFYRLSVFDIRIPPLRERLADVVPLSEMFLQEIGKSFGRPPAGLAREARQALVQYEWPGNVRELRNVLERASILCEGGFIDPTHLELESGARSHRTDTTDLSVVERSTIAKVLQECRGNKTRAARRLGVSRTQLHLRIRKYGLEEPAIA